MESNTEPAGSGPPEAGLIPTDKNNKGRRRDFTVCVRWGECKDKRDTNAFVYRISGAHSCCFAQHMQRNGSDEFSFAVKLPWL